MNNRGETWRISCYKSYFQVRGNTRMISPFWVQPNQRRTNIVFPVIVLPTHTWIFWNWNLIILNLQKQIDLNEEGIYKIEHSQTVQWPMAYKGSLILQILQIEVPSTDSSNVLLLHISTVHDKDGISTKCPTTSGRKSGFSCTILYICMWPILFSLLEKMKLHANRGRPDDISTSKTKS